MKSYEYNGYIIKQEKNPCGFGLAWFVYKNNELIGWDSKEKVAKEMADHHAQYN